MARRLAVEYADAPFSRPSFPLFFVVAVEAAFLVVLEYSIADTAGAPGADGVTLQMLTSGGGGGVSASIMNRMLLGQDKMGENRVVNMFYLTLTAYYPL
jgi:hypothetical protein